MISDNLVRNPLFIGKNQEPEGWSFNSPRPELMPGFGVFDDGLLRRLVIESNFDSHSFGYWEGMADLDPGEWYEASVRVRISGVQDPDMSVMAVFGEHFLEIQNKWSEDNLLKQIFRYDGPSKNASIGLYFRMADRGVIQWYEPDIRKINKPCFKKARIAVVRFGIPEDTGHDISSQSKRVGNKLDMAGAVNADLVLLPEYCQIIGVAEKIYGSYHETAQKVPDGPFCMTLSAAAKKYNMHVVAGVIEKRGSCMFNTAVVFDRQGSFAGQYDKTHLTFEEMKAGFSCGRNYPVFDLDFARTAIHICYDQWFPEVARYYAHRGIKLLLLPVSGGKPITWRTRAIDNGIYFAAASITPPSMIIDSSGEIIAQTHDDGVVFADIEPDYRKTNWYKDPSLVHGMPGIVKQMRNTADNKLLDEIYNDTIIL